MKRIPSVFRPMPGHLHYPFCTISNFVHFGLIFNADLLWIADILLLRVYVCVCVACNICYIESSWLQQKVVVRHRMTGDVAVQRGSHDWVERSPPTNSHKYQYTLTFCKCTGCFHSRFTVVTTGAPPGHFHRPSIEQYVCWFYGLHQVAAVAVATVFLLYFSPHRIA